MDVRVRRRSGQTPDAGVSPPWRPPPKVDPAPDAQPHTPSRPHRLIPPLVPEDISIEVQFPWKAILSLIGGFSLPAALTILIWLVIVVHNGRKAAGKRLILSDEELARLVELAKQFADEPPQPPKRKRSAKKTSARRRGGSLRIDRPG